MVKLQVNTVNTGAISCFYYFFGVSAPTTVSSSNSSRYFAAWWKYKRKATGLRQW